MLEDDLVLAAHVAVGHGEFDQPPLDGCRITAPLSQRFDHAGSLQAELLQKPAHSWIGKKANLDGILDAHRLGGQCRDPLGKSGIVG